MVIPFDTVWSLPYRLLNSRYITSGRARVNSTKLVLRKVDLVETNV